MSKPQELIDAQVARLAAEAELARAEARKALLEADQAELGLDEFRAMNRLTELRLAKAEEDEAIRLANDSHHRVFRLVGSVNGASVEKAIAQLVQWHRIDPECSITVVIDSGGGGIIEGFALYDTILWLRSQGHHFTTIAQGMAASMAGILLQAGTERVMGAQASILIHEASFGAMGSFGQVEDQVEFVRKLQDRLLGILAERSSLSKTQIRNRWKRKNWWLDAPEALTLQFVDRVA